MAAPGKPDIRGEQRTELIHDLADGSLSHAQLAQKWGRDEQSIKQFLARNCAAVEAVRAGTSKALHERLIAVPVSDKADRVAVYGQLRDDLLARLDDDDLDPRLRNHYTKTVVMLQRHAAEELGDLRTHVEVATPLRLGEVLAFGADGQLHEVVEPGCG